MAKMYQLSTCNTCQRILRELGEQPDLEVSNIKETPITAAELDRMAELAGSYEALFNRRAQKFRALGLAGQKLEEADYRRLILEEYTFLKRPVTIVGDQIFIGNAKQAVAGTAAALAKK
ncbi:ArsC/Spx/MgsR family protein [Neolewinella lacunae]|uniref:Arsenate reductase n=1 Tax=Neolewinella lacunae TaxID=1517758 RepID=A0A923PMZ4_9BACT|nr:ArsC/Spx/MgsR family protein [Neolewinella lacunae]MBC6996434.1 arsenate reductase [Neolewinella lacunae]MDN3633623.1 ArsC/Spx/MgsR family protein [Neolewinella lacunae]